MTAMDTKDPFAEARLLNALGELNVMAYSAAKAARIAHPNSKIADELKALALRTDLLLDGLS